MNRERRAFLLAAFATRQAAEARSTDVTSLSLAPDEYIASIGIGDAAVGVLVRKRLWTGARVLVVTRDTRLLWSALLPQGRRYYAVAVRDAAKLLLATTDDAGLWPTLVTFADTGQITSSLRMPEAATVGSVRVVGRRGLIARRNGIIEEFDTGDNTSAAVSDLTLADLDASIEWLKAGAETYLLIDRLNLRMSTYTFGRGRGEWHSLRHSLFEESKSRLKWMNFEGRPTLIVASCLAAHGSVLVYPVRTRLLSRPHDLIRYSTEGKALGLVRLPYIRRGIIDPGIAGMWLHDGVLHIILRRGEIASGAISV